MHKAGTTVPILTLVLALLCSTLIPNAVPQLAIAQGPGSGDNGERILVNADDTAAIQTLQANRAKLLVDYGPFSLWQLSATARGVAPQVLRTPNNLDTIYLRGGNVIDTRTPAGIISNSRGAAPLAITSQLLQQQTANQQFWMAQFIGPIKDEWLDQVRGIGFELVAYMPTNAYVLWGDEAAIGKLDDLISQGGVVRWAGPYHGAYRLAPSLQVSVSAGSRAIVDVTAQLFRGSATVSQSLATLISYSPRVLLSGTQVLSFTNITLQLPVTRLVEAVSLPDVYNVEPYVRPRLRDSVHDERQGQTLANQLQTSSGKRQPSGPGYLAWLDAQGVPTSASAWPVVAVVDDGIDNGNDTPLHPDFYELGNPTNADRLMFNLNCTPDANANGVAGHGNLNLGILGGYNSGAQKADKDSAGYAYGLGIAPYVRLAGAKIFANSGDFDLSQCDASFQGLTQRLWSAGARIASNSWGSNSAGTYDADSQTYDALIRDANSNATDGNQEMLQVFAAGNAGSGAYTVGSPGTAKNVLTVGATENVRDNGVIDGCGEANADNADDMAGFSSRGPTNDGRIKPDVVAPGTHVSGPASKDPAYSGVGVCGGPGNLPNGTAKFYPSGQITYTWSSGTSHSTPAVAGAVALAYEYYTRVINPKETPSPAMLKALLLNTPRYLNGLNSGGNLPGTAQGWGMVNLAALYTNTQRTVVDQSFILRQSGQVYTMTGNIASADRPTRITLAWTDAPGSTTGDAYVNDLDLTFSVNGQTYRGNVFNGANSATSGGYDTRNNVENVFLPAGLSGAYVLTITARNMAGDGVPGNNDPTDQDFALLLNNGNRISSTDAQAGDLQVGNVSQAEGLPSNANGLIDPGERAGLNITLANFGADASDIQATLSGPVGVTIVNGNSAYPNIPSNQSASNSTAFSLDIAPNLTCGPLALNFTAVYSAAGRANQMDVPLSLTIGNATLGATQRYTRTYSTALVVPDGNEVGVPSALVMPASGRVGDLKVRIDRIDHNFTSDLILRLIAPSGKSSILFWRRGESARNLRNLIFDDAATNTLDMAVPPGPLTGSYRPEQPLSVFAGESMSGNWQLVLSDNSTPDTGRLYSWGLILRPATYSCVVPPTPVPTKSATPTATPSRTPTPTKTATPTKAATATRTPTATATPKIPVTIFPTATKTATALPVSKSPTPSPTSKIPVTVFPTATNTANATSAVTSTQTSTPTATPINSTTATPTATPTVAATGEANVCALVVVTPNVRVPDNTSTLTCVPLSVAANGVVRGVKVKVGMTHTYLSDVRMQLRSPSGQLITLMNRPGFPANANGRGADLLASYPITFTDGAAQNAEQMGASLSRTQTVCRDDGGCDFSPAPEGDAGLTALGGFIGENSAGDWLFCVSDVSRNDVGTLASVELALTCDAGGVATATPAPTTIAPTPTVTPSTGADVCAPVAIVANKSIPDNNTKPTCFDVTVNSVGQVQGGSLQLTMAHTFASDLKVQLISPQGMTLTLMNRPRLPATRYGANADLSASYPITFSAGGATLAEDMGKGLATRQVICRDDKRCDFAPAPDGDPLSVNSFADLMGQPSAGVWRVCVSDVSRGDVGRVSGATLDLVCAAQ